MSKKTLNTKNWHLPKFEICEFRKKKTRYCVCIPVLNEGEKIKKQLQRMLPFSNLADIIIADWGSTDGSTDKKLLKKYNVRTLLVLKSPGRQGTQLRMGLSYAMKQSYEGVIQIDGNNKDGVEAIPNFILKLDAGYDFVQGSRYIKGGVGINTPLERWIGTRLICSPLFSLATGCWYTDIPNGFRAYSRKYLLHPGLQPFRNSFIRYEMILYLALRAAQLGLKTKEIPVERIYPDMGKTPTKIGTLGNIDYFLTILKVVLGWYNPKNYEN